jgi:DNA-binding NarL/FixJ family response regulator
MRKSERAPAFEVQPIASAKLPIVTPMKSKTQSPGKQTAMATGANINVALVEDDPGVRQRLATVLKHAPGIACVGAYASAEEAVRALPQLRPDVVFMDINLPDHDGVWAVQQLSPQLPKSQIVMLTVHDDTDTIFQSLAAGASGYLLKPVQSAELIDAVLNVSSGGVPMASNIARKIIQSFAQPAPAAPEGMETLTERELEVLGYLAKGYLYKEVAELMKISYRTVHTHIEHIYQKLHVRSRAEAAARYFQTQR